MPTVTISGQLIYFAHCPKAAGSTVEDYLAARFGKIGLLDRRWNISWRERGGRRNFESLNSPQHMVWDEAARTLPAAPDHVFSVVRDPLSRMKSEYAYLRGRPRRRVLLFLLTRLGFSIWLRIFLQIASARPHFMDNHFRPQTDFLPPETVVFRMEDGLDHLVAWLDSIAGAEDPSLKLPHSLKSKQVPVQIEPTQHDLDLIRIHFLRDYEEFGYDIPNFEYLSKDRMTRWKNALAKVVAPVLGILYDRGKF